MPLETVLGEGYERDTVFIYEGERLVAAVFDPRSNTRANLHKALSSTPQASEETFEQAKLFARADQLAGALEDLLCEMRQRGLHRGPLASVMLRAGLPLVDLATPWDSVSS